MRFKTKEKGPLKAEEINQAEKIMFRFVQAESFPNVCHRSVKKMEQE